MTVEQAAEIYDAIVEAGTHLITLRREDFTIFEGDAYLDGMDPREWIFAMTMD